MKNGKANLEQRKGTLDGLHSASKVWIMNLICLVLLAGKEKVLNKSV